MAAAPTLFPYLRFEDADAGIAWQRDAFGFAEHAVHRDDDGAIVHAELSLGNGIVMVGRGDPAATGIYAAVEDVDAHHARAVAAGAEIVRPPEDTPYGSREYTARDPAGHAWSFGTYNPYRDRAE